MIYSFGISQQGKKHIRNNIVCQDAYYIKVIDERICIAAVADGLGSETKSDIAAAIASKTAVEYCSEKITKDISQENIELVIKESFDYALSEIENKVIQDKGDILQYDTTLSLCVLIEGILYFGHSGDSGIIALADDGKFYKITEQQRDEEGRVFPLCFGEECWTFGRFDKTVAGVILATDGMFDTFFPIYIRNMEINIYTSLAKYFLNMQTLKKEGFDIKEYKNKRYDYILNIPENIVDDDKTIVGIMDDSIFVNWQEDEYYREPDWKLLKEKYKTEYNKKAYSEVNVE